MIMIKLISFPGFFSFLVLTIDYNILMKGAMLALDILNWLKSDAIHYKVLETEE